MTIENQETTENQEMTGTAPVPGEQKPEVVTVELQITDEIKNYLRLAGKWGMFLSILGFIFMGLMVFAGFIISIALSFIPTVTASPLPFPPFLFGFLYLVIGAVYFFPILYLYRFSSGIKQALAQNDQDRLTRAFYYLKAQYRFIGILMIVMLALYVVMFAVMIFAGLFAGLSGLSGVSGMPA